MENESGIEEIVRGLEPGRERESCRDRHRSHRTSSNECSAGRHSVPVWMDEQSMLQGWSHELSNAMKAVAEEMDVHDEHELSKLHKESLTERVHRSPQDAKEQGLGNASNQLRTQRVDRTHESCQQSQRRRDCAVPGLECREENGRKPVVSQESPRSKGGVICS